MTSSRQALMTVPALLLLAAPATPTLAASLHGPSQATSPRQLALTVADVNAALGGGFFHYGGMSADPLQGMAGMHASTKAGYVSGYEVMFQRPRPTPLVVETGVTLFRSRTAAQAGITRVLATYSIPNNRQAGVRVARIGSLGDTALTLSFSTRQSGHTFSEHGYLFSRGRYDGEIVAIGSGTSAPRQSAILGLARLLDSRVQRG